jgi:rRNA maturation endonuclease Nob1
VFHEAVLADMVNETFNIITFLEHDWIATRDSVVIDGSALAATSNAITFTTVADNAIQASEVSSTAWDEARGVILGDTTSGASRGVTEGMGIDAYRAVIAMVDTLRQCLDSTTLIHAEVLNLDGFNPITDNDSLIIDRSTILPQIADAVLDEDTVGHYTPGNFAYEASQTAATALTEAGIADAVWDEIITGHTTQNSMADVIYDSLDQKISGTTASLSDADITKIADTLNLRTDNFVTIDSVMVYGAVEQLMADSTVTLSDASITNIADTLNLRTDNFVTIDSEMVYGAVEQLIADSAVVVADTIETGDSIMIYGPDVDIELDQLTVATADGDAVTFQTTAVGGTALEVQGIAALSRGFSAIGTQYGVYVDGGASADIYLAEAGEALNSETIADANWNEDSAGHYTPGQMAYEASQTAATALTVASISEGVWAHDDSLDADTSQIGTWLVNNAGGADQIGVGATSLNYYVVDSATSPDSLVPNVTLTIRTIAGTREEVKVGSNGWITFNVDSADTYIVTAKEPGYIFETDTVTIDTLVFQDSIFGYNTATTSICRVYLYAADIGATADDAVTLTLQLSGRAVSDTCNGTVITDYEKLSAYADASGYVFVDLVRSSCLSRDVKFRGTVTSSKGTTKIPAFTVPDQSTYDLKNVIIN